MPAYTIDPTDELMPTDDKAAMYAAAEVRALKGRINDLVADWDPLVTAGRAKPAFAGVEAHKQTLNTWPIPLVASRYIPRPYVNYGGSIASDAGAGASAWACLVNLPVGRYTQPAAVRAIYDEGAGDTQPAPSPQFTGNSVASLTRAGVVVTVTTTLPHGLAVGQHITVAGAVPSSYDVQDTEITSVPTTTTFTYNAYSTPATSPATGVGLVSRHTPVYAQTGAARGDGSYKITWSVGNSHRSQEVSYDWPSALRAAGSAPGWVYVSSANAMCYVDDIAVANVEYPIWQVADFLDPVNPGTFSAIVFAAGRYHATAEFGLAVSTMYSQLHALGVVPKTTRAVLVCKTADLGWTPGQELEVGPAVTGVVVSSGRLYAHVTTGTAIGILNKATGAAGNITPASWKLKLYFDRGYE